MTWFASGIAFASIGADIEAEGAISNALDDVAGEAEATDFPCRHQHR